jgi:hypothetical protein
VPPRSPPARRWCGKCGSLLHKPQGAANSPSTTPGSPLVRAGSWQHLDRPPDASASIESAREPARCYSATIRYQPRQIDRIVFAEPLQFVQFRTHRRFKIGLAYLPLAGDQLNAAPDRSLVGLILFARLSRVRVPPRSPCIQRLTQTPPRTSRDLAMLFAMQGREKAPARPAGNASGSGSITRHFSNRQTQSIWCPKRTVGETSGRL